MKIPPKPPTLADIRNENVLYSTHLIRGGEPIRIILELVPTQIGFDWRMENQIPNNLPKMPYSRMFTGYAIEKITAALQPPNENSTDTKKASKPSDV